MPPPSPPCSHRHSVSPTRRWVALSWAPSTMATSLVGWPATKPASTTGRPVFRATNVPDCPAAADRNTPPSHATQTWVPSFVNRMARMSGWTPVPRLAPAAVYTRGPAAGPVTGLMKRPASVVDVVPPTATLAGLEGSTATTIFVALMDLPPHTAGAPPTSTAVGAAGVASTPQRRGPSPRTH